MTAYAGLVKVKHEGVRACEDELAAARAEAEALAASLHETRMHELGP